MAGFRAAAWGGAMLTMMLGAPLAAQQPPDAPRTTPTTPGTSAPVPDVTVNKAGAALRQVTAIRQSYSPRIAAAKSADEKQGLQRQAMDESVKAVNGQGLSVDQFNQVIRQAQADPDLEQRLLAAAK